MSFDVLTLTFIDFAVTVLPFVVVTFLLYQVVELIIQFAFLMRQAASPVVQWGDER